VGQTFLSAQNGQTGMSAPQSGKRRQAGSLSYIDSRSGSALLIVLAAVAILALLIAGFGRELRGELRASNGFYDDAQNRQLAFSALAAAQIELARTNASLYADAAGNSFFVMDDSFYETEIEELMFYRAGVPLGRGQFAYRFIIKPFALDVNDLTATQWHRLFEVACNMDDSPERSALVDAILDWRDADDNAREYGAEEEFYQSFEPPRHCRNGDFETVEELLLVNGMSPEILYGYGMPAAVENGLLTGGGIFRRFIGDNSAAVEAAQRYILAGALPADDSHLIEKEESVFTKVAVLPDFLYLVADGFQDVGAMRYTVLMKLILSADGKNYTAEELNINAAGELLDAVLAETEPEEMNEL